MIIYECIIPQIDVNDKRIVVNDFQVNDGDFVEKLQTILYLETAKAVSEFYSEASGYIAYAVQEGDELAIGDSVALIFDSDGEALEYAKQLKQRVESQKKTYKATARAEKLAQELGVDISRIGKEGIIKEADVRELYEAQRGTIR